MEETTGYLASPTARSLGRILDTQPDLVVIGEAPTVGEAVGTCLRPRFVLADLDLADAGRASDRDGARPSGPATRSGRLRA